MEYGAFHNENNWVKLFQQGDEQALQLIFEEYNDRLFLYANRFVELTSEAEDITAEAFIKLWDRRKQFEDLDTIRAFLHRTVKNRCLDYLRRQKTFGKHQHGITEMIEQRLDGDFLVEMIRLELMKKIYEEVDKLPKKMREIFMLSYKEGLKPAEIAEQLNLNVQTVKNQRVTAIKLLRQAFHNNHLVIAALAVLELKTVH